MDGFFAKEIHRCSKAPERGGKTRPNHLDFDRFTERREGVEIAAIVPWRRYGWPLEIAHLNRNLRFQLYLHLWRKPYACPPLLSSSPSKRHPASVRKGNRIDTGVR